MISRNKIIYRATLLVVFLAIINTLSTKFYWYSLIWYFDMPMHFLGGVSIGLLVAYLTYTDLFPHTTIKKMLLLVGAVIVVGIGWEVFEYIFNNYIGGQPFDLEDTLSDIFFDTVGAFVSVLYLWVRK